MARLFTPRSLLRFNTPAKLLLVLFALVFYLSFSFSTSHPPSIFTDSETRKHIQNAPLSELVNLYEQVRHGALRAKGFNGTVCAESIKAPKTLPDGTSNLDPDLEVYMGRLRDFIDNYLQQAPAHIHIAARNTLKSLIKRESPRYRDGSFPAKVWATHPAGIKGVQLGFELWGKVLPFPLPPALANQISVDKDVDFLQPARDGQDWDVEVPDDDGLDRIMTEWTGQKLQRGIPGEGKWSELWGGLEMGVLRADVFRYTSMLVAGGVYSDSDTMPISHPFLWGLHAPSNIINPDLELLAELIVNRGGPKFPPNTRPPRIDSRSLPQHNSSYTPPYPGIERRSPVYVSIPNPATILNPRISMVIAIEWDNKIGRTLGMWRQWTWSRFTESSKYPRNIEFAQNLLVAKPFHPIMLDTVATIAQLVKSGEAKSLRPACHLLELTGPGPFTDAVLRYLLVQYGVTPEDLRALRGPVRIGDILILQEEAWHAPFESIKQLWEYVESLHLKLGTNRHGRFSPWLFGLGWKDWKSGGVKVAYHGLTGIWKDKDY
ncbi:hypothetical protein I350_07377 [Cryptococcus amylolentus CBS 6273]|uniref:Alpha-1,6-mannosyltransferase n=1 Tax=Cryptococcus amylolentus CBS 6273 TaxID=1296118 RepID=A0A1E3JEA3_9TREE|nr:hypothetical protein I350_07377 [Cryptococcus amylolentus CBS 6273]